MSRRALVIARRELQAFFHAPSGLVVATLFLALQGVVMWLFVKLLNRPDAPPGAVMEFFFGGTMLYWLALAMLAAVLPMRLLSEELRSGTIEPLLTAPVREVELVVGKWLGAVAYYASLWAPTLLYVVYLRTVHAHLDPGPIAAGYLGTLLLGAAVLAVGLAASALTRSQLLAGAASFAAFFLAVLMAAMPTQLQSPFWRTLLRRVSLLHMMEDFGHGIVDSRHVVLLATVTVLGLLAAHAALRMRRRGGSFGLRLLVGDRAGVVSTLLLVLIAGMLNYLAGRHYVRCDWTGSRIYSLSDKTVQVVRALPMPVRALAFLAPRREAEEDIALGGMARELLERFRAASPDRFGYEIVDPDRDPRRTEAVRRQHGISEPDMAEGVIVFTAGQRSRFVTRDDLVEYAPAEVGMPGARVRAFKGEPAFLSALLAVSDEQPATVCFLRGHGEPDIDSFEDGGYAYIAEEVRRDAHQVKAVEPPGAAGVPAQCSVLVISEPQRALADAELAALDRYVDGGGRVLVMLGPVFSGNGRAFGQVGLESWLVRRGIRMGDDLVVDPGHASDIEGPSVWAASSDDYGSHPVMARLAGRPTFWPRVREVRPVAGGGAHILVQSSEQGWGETDLATVRGDADLVFNADRDVKGPVPVAAAVEKPAGNGRPGRVVALGTGRLVMNYRLGGLVVRDYNRDLFLSVVGWLADKQHLVGVAPKAPEHIKLTLERWQVARVFHFFVVGLPLAFLVVAGVVWHRRRS